MARPRTAVLKEIKATHDKLVLVKKRRNKEGAKYLRAKISELQAEALKSEP
jgi:hypothetical protein